MGGGNYSNQQYLLSHNNQFQHPTISLVDYAFDFGWHSLSLGSWDYNSRPAVAFGCYKEFQNAKGKKYLTILLNSGYTYSILFNDHSFLSKVFHVFANILDEGTSPSINYFIDMVNCKIDNNSSVVAEAGR